MQVNIATLIMLSVMAALFIVGVIKTIISATDTYKLSKSYSDLENELSECTHYMKLEKCPFCGSDCADVVAQVFEDNGEIEGYYTECSPELGGCGGRTSLYDKASDALLAWNARNGVVNNFWTRSEEE